ncbi:MAG: acyl-CoA dehydrogenase family protein, partial [Alphaproteobacteria bacterium]|nr:acyl-CoA dehydrogenase family protein [Alphaproteobacteria bacterium]
MLNLTEEQIAIRDTFARFTDEQIVPNAEAIDLAHEYPRDVVKQLADLGFVGMRYPEEIGGSNVDLVTFCLCVEEIA